MKSLVLENSPIAYYVDNSANNSWVVFLHAAFVDHRMFEKQFAHFSGKFNLLAVDILGHGNSTKAQKGDDVQKMSNWINEIFEKHLISAAHFVGVSLGAVFVQDFANKHPDKVLSLACFGGYDINNFDVKKQKANSKAQMAMMFKAMFSITWFAKANKKISAFTSEAQEEFYKLNLQFKKKSFMHLAKLQKLINQHPPKQRQYPLLVGCGEHDIPMEIEIVNEWAAAENCHKVILPNAGHCANMDAPSAFNSCLEEFWKSAQPSNQPTTSKGSI